MKKSIYIKSFAVLILFAAGMVACDVDKLDTPSLVPTEEEIFVAPNDFLLYTLGMYGKMTDFYAPQKQLYQFHHLPGDDISFVNGGWGPETFQGMDAGWNRFQQYYESLYHMVHRANLFINKTEAGDENLWAPGDDNQLDYFKGEAYFFRAFAHFRLYILFGTAPVVTQRISGIDQAHIPRSTGVELLDQAIADWEEAATLLPVSWAAEYRGRAFRSSANGMLMKAYMLRGDYTGNAADYQSALTVFNRITDRSLTDDYIDNFNMFTENNEESIFEFQASIAPAVDNIWLSNDGDNGASQWAVVESMGATWRYFSTEGNNGFNQSPWTVTEKVLALAGDPRLDSLIHNPGTDNIFLKYGRLDLDVTNGGPVENGGFGDPNGTNSNSSLNNPRIMRYAECLLLAAEATILSGGTVADAIDFVNEVRERADNWAGNGDGTTVPPLVAGTLTGGAGGTAMDAIQEERLIELCGEEFVRFTDLKRWHARGDADFDLSVWDGSDQYFSTRQAAFGFNYPQHLLWPIPDAEISRNNAINENNTGW